MHRRKPLNSVVSKEFNFSKRDNIDVPNMAQLLICIESMELDGKYNLNTNYRNQLARFS